MLVGQFGNKFQDALFQVFPFVKFRVNDFIVVDHDVRFIDYLTDTMLVFEGTSGKEGHVHGPCSKEEGMTRVLKMLNITYRKDRQTGRAQINKPDSQLDKEQKNAGKYYVS